MRESDLVHITITSLASDCSRFALDANNSRASGDITMRDVRPQSGKRLPPTQQSAHDPGKASDPVGLSVATMEAARLCVVFSHSAHQLVIGGRADEVAEWLRRWTANPLCSARVGSNPILVGRSFLCCTRRMHSDSARTCSARPLGSVCWQGYFSVGESVRKYIFCFLISQDDGGRWIGGSEHYFLKKNNTWRKEAKLRCNGYRRGGRSSG